MHNNNSCHVSFYILKKDSDLFFYSIYLVDATFIYTDGKKKKIGREAHREKLPNILNHHYVNILYKIRPFDLMKSVSFRPPYFFFLNLAFTFHHINQINFIPFFFNSIVLIFYFPPLNSLFLYKRLT